MNFDLSPILSCMGLLHWYNLIEIGCYAAGVYCISRWLARDTQKNLVMPFYVYCLALCISYSLNLPSVYFLLLYATPLVCIGFTLFHQTLLQKNFIGMTKRVQAVPMINEDWIDNLMRGSLHAINTNKKFSALVEHYDDIFHCISSSFKLNAPLENNILEFLFDSPRYNDDCFIVVDVHGYIKAVNAHWLHRETDGVVSQNDSEWVSYCVELTQKTDAIMITISPEQRLFTVYVQGKIVEHVTAPSVITLLKNFTQPLLKAGKNKQSSVQGAFNESFSKKTIFKQTRPES